MNYFLPSAYDPSKAVSIVTNAPGRARQGSIVPNSGNPYQRPDSGRQPRNRPGRRQAPLQQLRAARRLRVRSIRQRQDRHPRRLRHVLRAHPPEQRLFRRRRQSPGARAARLSTAATSTTSVRRFSPAAPSSRSASRPSNRAAKSPRSTRGVSGFSASWEPALPSTSRTPATRPATWNTSVTSASYRSGPASPCCPRAGNVSNAIRPYRGFTGVTMVEFGSNSNYHGLQTRVSRRFGKQLTANASFVMEQGARPDRHRRNHHRLLPGPPPRMGSRRLRPHPRPSPSITSTKLPQLSKEPQRRRPRPPERLGSVRRHPLLGRHAVHHRLERQPRHPGQRRPRRLLGGNPYADSSVSAASSCARNCSSSTRSSSPVRRMARSGIRGAISFADPASTSGISPY